ncbi:SDR family oxidoreductase [Propionibacteriaceae bacterium G1746]|uniref:SDR family oxidoreductase n=1 Tax=Aestuariimicrobium sp. G57 TaxID=3418485 RepID=UPI003C15858C
MTTVAITGATGYLGGQVARQLDDAGLSPRLVVRDPTSPRMPHLPGVRDVRGAGYGEHAAAVTALRGVDLLFMVSASESADRLTQHRSFVAAAAEAGVRHVVYTSFQGAAPDATFTLARDHWATEQAIRDSGMAYTFLRDSFYLDFLPHLADESGVIRGPAGDGRVAAVARADVVRVAAQVLCDPGAHHNVAYDLTGREALTLDEAAQIISQSTGRHVTYVRESVEQAHRSRARLQAPAWQVEAWVSTYLAIAAGEVAAVSTAVHDITGREPLTLKQVLAAR